MGAVTQPQHSFYDDVGGHETFTAIVAKFYELVREDEILLPLYPEDDIDGAEERLRLFLEQYWAGREPTRISAATRGCGCAMHRFGSGSLSATPGCGVCTPPSPRSTHKPWTTATAGRCWTTSRWPPTRW